MKKKYRVTWNETYFCSKVVEAESEDDAVMSAFIEGGKAEKRELVGYENVDSELED